MKKSELVAQVADAAQVSRANAAVVIDALAYVTQKHMRDGSEALLPGLGKLVTSARPGRQGRNPKTGEVVQIPPSVAVKFKASSELKAAVQ